LIKRFDVYNLVFAGLFQFFIYHLNKFINALLLVSLYTTRSLTAAATTDDGYNYDQNEEDSTCCYEEQQALQAKDRKFFFHDLHYRRIILF